MIGGSGPADVQQLLMSRFLASSPKTQRPRAIRFWELWQWASAWECLRKRYPTCAHSWHIGSGSKVRIHQSIGRKTDGRPSVEELNGSLSKCGKAALVDSRLYVAISNALQINHGRGYIAMPHPLLQRADVDSVLKVARVICVAKFVQEPAATICSFGAAVDLYRSAFQLVRSDTVTTVKFSSKRHSFKFFQHRPIRAPSG